MKEMLSIGGLLEYYSTCPSLSHHTHTHTHEHTCHVMSTHSDCSVSGCSVLDVHWNIHVVNMSLCHFITALHVDSIVIPCQSQRTHFHPNQQAAACSQQCAA